MKNPLYTSRIGVIDSLRGLAVMAIFLIHTSNHFLFDRFPADPWAFDTVLRDGLYFMFEGKAYTIFALLFGFTFALQMEGYRTRLGRDFGGRMFWRLVVLIFIGLFNCALFAGGDPLVFYALTMMLIIPLRNLSTRVLTILAFLFLIQPIELLNSIYGFWGESYVDSYVALNGVLVEGDALSTFLGGVTLGLEGCLRWALETGRFTQTIGLFLVGILAYRYRAFDSSSRWSSYFWVYGIASVVLFCASEWLFGFFRVYYNLFFTLTLASLFVVFYRRFSRGWFFVGLSCYGRMSLTNFVFQSLFGALLYYPWGFDLGSYLGVGVSLLITFGLIILQVWFSYFWLRYYRRGILESLWHRLTYIWG